MEVLLNVHVVCRAALCLQSPKLLGRGAAKGGEVPLFGAAGGQLLATHSRPEGYQASVLGIAQVVHHRVLRGGSDPPHLGHRQLRHCVAAHHREGDPLRLAEAVHCICCLAVQLVVEGLVGVPFRRLGVPQPPHGTHPAHLSPEQASICRDSLGHIRERCLDLHCQAVVLSLCQQLSQQRCATGHPVCCGRFKPRHIVLMRGRRVGLVGPLGPHRHRDLQPGVAQLQDPAA
mmetsp:Transcript_4299/g.12115  ORF Transcript_4299/g.12115 Transcript_4299/m.12115 type:complete len:231 (+) Transcript_4299:596-1288(+)